MMLVQLLGGGGMRRLRRVDNSTSRTTKQARENPRYARINSHHIFIKYILRENLPSVELNSHYIQ